MNRKDFLENFPRAQIDYDLPSFPKINYCILLGKKSPILRPLSVSLILTLSEEYSTIIISDLKEKNHKLYKEFNTEEYIDIIYKIYKHQNREEIEQRWRVSRLRLKLKSIKKEETTKQRRKI